MPQHIPLFQTGPGNRQVNPAFPQTPLQQLLSQHLVFLHHQWLSVRTLQLQLFWQRRSLTETLKALVDHEKVADQLKAWALSQPCLCSAPTIHRAVDWLLWRYEDLIVHHPQRPHQQQKSVPALHATAIEKYFGHALGIDMVSKAGIHTQGGFIGPALHALTDKISDYANAFSGSPADSVMWQKIADAYRFTQDVGQYKYSQPRHAAAHALYQRYLKGDMTIVPTGWSGHVIGVAFVNNHMVLTNRGRGGDDKYGTQIFEIKDKAQLTPQFFDAILQANAKNCTPTELHSQLAQIVKPTPVFKIRTSTQKWENCTYANPKGLVQGLLAIEFAKKHGQPLSHAWQFRSKIRQAYKALTHDMRCRTIDELITGYQHARSGVEKIRYADLMHAYLKQHPKSQFSKPVRTALCSHPVKLSSRL